jgi:hypothetical protein
MKNSLFVHFISMFEIVLHYEMPMADRQAGGFSFV